MSGPRPATGITAFDGALRAVVAAARAGRAGVRPLTARSTRAAVGTAYLDLVLLRAAARGAAPWVVGQLVPRLPLDSARALAAVLGPALHRDDGPYGEYRRQVGTLAALPAAGPVPLDVLRGDRPPFGEPAAYDGPLRTPTRELTRDLVAELDELRSGYGALAPGDPRGWAAAERHALLGAAAACLSQSRHSGPELLLGALGRVAVRLGRPAPECRTAWEGAAFAQAVAA
nr:hypothetical protein OH820_28255 [Streptomyces sp. NBC_00857]